ncbi:MAG: asparagine synthase (glutamine-hydrolyzing) [Methylobacter sp.]|nr:MAG: asparagine synthase (glutamine-hydrolyzing) [Methylobacter sp.]PPD19203.1 MAG: asparagine synthase (glutamine-hydrolyzing) [Methylobacter sp.]
MCGFAGYLSPDGTIAEQVLTRMSQALAHRGPDDSGLWYDNAAGIGFAHRRLAVVDLSPAGHQPMTSCSRRYTLVFNGEIYNHLALRAQLESAGNASIWRGRSDTETLLACFDAWGIEAAVKKSIGAFAFAVWDKQRRQLTLGRDRFGEKPLYYGWQGQGQQKAFLFGSELKALREHPSFERNINRGALSLQCRHSYIPAPYSIYHGIAKLRPGCLLTVSAPQPDAREVIYWSVVHAVESGVAKPYAGNAEQAVEDLEILLKKAVHQQMAADVPLGAFLSGGVDSSLVVALMQAQAGRPVKTFSIGFYEDGFNEAVHAKAVAQHLGTDHTELYVTAEQAMAVIPRLPNLYDEPFADSSQIPTFLVAQLAKQQVTVALSGDAGDELFCGYNRYLMTANLWHKIARLPLALRRLLAKGLVSLPPDKWNALARMLPVNKSVPPVNWGDKLHKGADLLSNQTVDELYSHFITHWMDTTSLVIDGSSPPALINEVPALPALNDIQRMMALDCMTYLPDSILVKVDRAAMAVALETRVPFLDHRVVEFAWQLPQSLKLRDHQSKWILRQILYRHVPKALIERPKMGFGVPIGDWLRGPLREWAEALLDETRLRQEGFFYPAPVRQKWQEHLSGRRNWQYLLWDVLMFQAWLEAQ